MSLNYKIFETKQLLSDLQAAVRHRSMVITKKLAEYVYPQLKREPHFGLNIKRLKNWHPPTWRYRVGEWRFFYTIDETARVISMIAASHRKDAYR